MINEIVIRSVYGKVNQIYFIQPCPNPRTGKLPDCVRTVDSNGDMILSEEDIRKMSAGEAHYIPADKIFEIVDGSHFNLSDIVDKAEWEAIQYCNWIAKDRYERDSNGDLVIDGGAKRYGVADLYVERPGEITRVKVSRKELVFRAEKYIWEDTESDRLKKAKVLGRDLELAPTADVLDFLLETASKDPNKIIDLYEGEDWKMQLFIIEAIDRGVIRKTDGIYRYDDKMLGGSMGATIATLKDIRYSKILESIKRETYPNLLPKQEQEKIQAELTVDISKLADENPIEPKKTASKGPIKIGNK